MRLVSTARIRRVAVLLAALSLPTAVNARADAMTATPERPVSLATSSTHRVLFDNTKAETAGNADWIISTGQPDPLTQNPTPQSEADWTGAISS